MLHQLYPSHTLRIQQQTRGKAFRVSINDAKCSSPTDNESKVCKAVFWLEGLISGFIEYIVIFLSHQPFA
jgi:hypothetical protein